ncbi:hypothetical protein HYX11_00925 [Candidatus Woesearchaeota archaeon]|nr:hypothetical protein [Candidatus Woesearchaeota archaeon]
MPKKINSLMKNVRRMLVFQQGVNFGLIQTIRGYGSSGLPINYFDDGDDDDDDFEDE